jgi:AcrR family transcriptional regulator
MKKDQLPKHAKGHSTREALLDAAEERLAHKGVAATSVRDIIRAAGANLGSVNYYFRSKDHLIAEVILRRIRPVDQARLKRLEELEALAAGRKLDPKDILDALIRPLVESQLSQGKHTIVFRLLDQAFHDSDPQVRELVDREFSKIRERFTAALLKALPELPPEELLWRIHYFFGGLSNVLNFWTLYDDLLTSWPKPAPRRLSKEEFMSRVVTFAIAVLSAPACACSVKG